MYRICKTHSDQSLCVSELAEACVALKRKLGYSDPDARTVALDNIIAFARSGQAILNLLDSWAKGDAVIRQVIPQLIGLKTVTPNGVQMTGNFLDKTNKLSLLLLGQFQIENLIRNISRELKLSMSATGFYKIASSLLTALNIPGDRMDVLNVTARLRNSLHSNGIYHRQHPSEQPLITVRGITYEFHNGQHISCASWEHIAHSLEASIGVMEEVLLSSSVLAIPDPMMDQYAWAQATNP